MVGPNGSAAVGAEAQVQVRFFASFREAAGVSRTVAEIEPGMRVADLQVSLEQRFGSLRLGRGMVAVNQEYVGPDFALHAGDEVAFIPPVSGGCA